MTPDLLREELCFVQRVANAQSPAVRDNLLMQLAAVISVKRDADRIEFVFQNDTVRIYSGHKTIGEGKLRDVDGEEIDVCLNVDQNHDLLEIEFIRYDCMPVQAPNWSTLRMIR